MLSALGDEIDKVLLLEIGADDYVVKPFRHARVVGSHPGAASAHRAGPMVCDIALVVIVMLK